MKKATIVFNVEERENGEFDVYVEDVLRTSEDRKISVSMKNDEIPVRLIREMIEELESFADDLEEDNEEKKILKKENTE